MPSNPFYRSPAWRALRQAALRRDGCRCVVPGCTAAAVVVDHITARPRGATGLTAADTLGNLRCLCRYHDNQLKENAHGVRRGGGAPVVHGCDAAGRPRDPNHPWNRR